MTGTTKLFAIWKMWNADWEVHNTDCSCSRKHLDSVQAKIEAKNEAEAVAVWIDADLREMGYDESSCLTGKCLVAKPEPTGVSKPKKFSWAEEQGMVHRWIAASGTEGLTTKSLYFSLEGHLYDAGETKREQLRKLRQYGFGAVKAMLDRLVRDRLVVQRADGVYEVPAVLPPAPAPVVAQPTPDLSLQANRTSDRRHNWCGPIALTVMTGLSYERCEDELYLVRANHDSRFISKCTDGHKRQNGIKGTYEHEVTQAAQRLGLRKVGEWIVMVERVTCRRFIERQTADQKRQMLLVCVGHHWVVLHAGLVYDFNHPTGTPIAVSRFSRSKIKFYVTFERK